ncbi:MAG: GAF domain-containing protein [Halobacteriaceae archaeon]
MANGRTDHLLVVDDDPEVLGLLREWLDRSDHEFAVETTTDPTAALERFRAEPVDCVVSDYQMPEMTGVDLLRAVREVDPEVPFVLFTGHGSEAVASEAINAGVTRYVTKDLDRAGAARLVDAVTDALRTARHRAAIREELGPLSVALGEIPDVVVVTDTLGHPVYWNEAAASVTGYDGDPSVTVFDLVPDGEGVGPAFERVCAGETVTIEVPLDGSPYEFTVVPIATDDRVFGVCAIGRDVSDRLDYERTLETLHRTTRSLLDAEDRAAIAELVASATAHIVSNPASLVFLVEGDRLVPAGVSAGARALLGAVDPYDVDASLPVPVVHRTGEPAVVEDVAGVGDERDRGPIERALLVPVGDAGVLVVGRTEDRPFTDRDRTLVDVLAANATAALGRQEREALLGRRAEMLSTLLARTRTLIEATTREAVAEVARDAAGDLVGTASVGVFVLAPETGRLDCTAATPDFQSRCGDLETVGAGESPVWQAFLHTSTTRVADEPLGVCPAPTPVEHAVVVPVAQSGAIVVESEAPPDDATVEYLELLAASTASALERTDRLATLREQERTLERQNERLERLNRLNATIRSINAALVDADSRLAVREAVTEQLADVDHYALAWIGEPTEDELAVRSVHGDGYSLVEAVADQVADDDAPASLPERAVERDEPVVVNDVLRSPAVQPVRDAALSRQLHSVVALPLAHRDRRFGVLEVYADRPEAFDEEEVAVLSELADGAANALHAVTAQEALVADRTTELEFRVEDGSGPLFALAGAVGATLSVEDLVARADGDWRVFASTADADPDDVVAAAGDCPGVRSAGVVRSDPGRAIVELVADLALPDVFAERGAAVAALEVGPDGGRVTVQVPAASDVREFVDAAESAVAGLSLVRRETVGGAPEVTVGIEDVLTDRQLEVLKTAYLAGYFEWPRGQTGEEVAAQLDISGPTFQQHVRKGLDRLFAEIFDG